MCRLIAIVTTGACVTLTASFASSGAQRAGDLEQLQGKWTAVNKIPNGSIRVVIEIKDNAIYSAIGDGLSMKPTSVQEITLDEHTKPKQISFTNGKSINIDPNSLAAKISPPNMKAAYELKGDTFTVCTNILDGKVPTKVGPGKNIALVVYRRGELTEEQMKAFTTPVAKAKIAAPKLEVAGDLLALQGTWRNKSGQLNSEKETLTVEGDTLTAKSKSGRVEVQYSSQIKLDETSSPKSIDFLNPSVGTSKKKNLKPAFGIYELEGDTLKIHKSGVGRGRATVFEDGAEQGSVSVWTRAAAGRNGASTGTAKGQRKSATPAQTASAPATPVNKLKRATVGKTMKDYISLTIDGAEVRIYKDEPHAATYDIAGKQLPNSSAIKMLQEGNIVDVDFFAKDPAHPYYLLSEIHLIQGEIR